MPATPEQRTEAGIVFDATVLSNFAHIEQFHWLERLYAGRGWTTLMVVEPFLTPDTLIDECRKPNDEGNPKSKNVPPLTPHT